MFGKEKLNAVDKKTQLTIMSLSRSMNIVDQIFSHLQYRFHPFALTKVQKEL